MKISKKLLAAALVLAVIAVTAISGCISTPGQQSNTETRQAISEPRHDEGGNAMITSTYAGSGIFRLTVDTHSGSMDAHIDSMDHAAPADLPLDKMAYLQDSAGNVYQPVYWQGDTSGHHLNGTLRFTKFDDSKSFKLVLKGVEGVEERVLQW